MLLPEHGANLLSERLHPFYTPRVEELFLSFLENKANTYHSNCFLTLALWEDRIVLFSFSDVCVAFDPVPGFLKVNFGGQHPSAISV